MGRVEENESINKREARRFFRLNARGRLIEFPRRPLLMGILNINDDSFSGDGQLDVGWARCRARELVEAGADIVDVGAESARTNRAAISIDEECARLLPFVRTFAEAVRGAEPRDPEQLFPPLLSINTWRPEVADCVLREGGDLLNDMSALPTAANARIAAREGAALLIMHSIGEPKVAHTHVGYSDILTELKRFFAEKIALARQAGLAEEAIVLDPGIDFAKQCADNLTLLARAAELQEFGRPVLLPISRKTVIGQVLDLPNPLDREAGTLACLVAGTLRGAQIFRIHDVNAAYPCLRALHKIPAREWPVD